MGYVQGARSVCDRDDWMDVWRDSVLVSRNRLRWFGHVERKSEDDWVHACQNLEVEGARGQG
jgi:hypothetical protein